MRAFDNRLIFPNLRHTRRILECGFGNGAWAIDVARANPGCEASTTFLPDVGDARDALIVMRWQRKFKDSPQLTMQAGIRSRY